METIQPEPRKTMKNRSLFEFVAPVGLDGVLPIGYSFPDKEKNPTETIEIEDANAPEIDYGIQFHDETQKKNNNAKVYKEKKPEIIQYCLVNGKKNTLVV
jgi:hypothetical protein